MTTLRGSFHALHRLVERKLRRLCTALGHPESLHAAALRKVKHPAAKHLLGEASVTRTPAPAEEPMPVEVDHTPFGFEVPDEDNPVHMLRETSRRGEKERANMNVRDKTLAGT